MSKSTELQFQDSRIVGLYPVHEWKEVVFALEQPKLHQHACMLSADMHADLFHVYGCCTTFQPQEIRDTAKNKACRPRYRVTDILIHFWLGLQRVVTKQRMSQSHAARFSVNESSNKLYLSLYSRFSEQRWLKASLRTMSKIKPTSRWSVCVYSKHQLIIVKLR